MTSTSQFDGRNFPGVDIWIKAKDPAIRHREPVTCGIPWPKGMLHEPYSLVLRDQNANEIPVQARTLDRWPDGSVRWVLLDWQATVNGDARLRLEISDYLPAMPTAGSLRVQRENVTIKGRTFHKLTHIRTGMGVCHINNGFLITFDTTPDSGPGRSYSIELRLRVEFDRKTLIGNELRPLVNQIQAKENGLIRSSVLVAGQLIGGYFKHLPVFQAQVVFFSRSPCVRIFFTICNPKRAKHTGGIWCLGDKGSAFVRDASFTIEIPDARLEQLERDKKTAIA